jgi:hypothetical protein
MKRTDIPHDENGVYTSTRDRVTLKPAALVKLVNEYIQRYRKKGHRPNIVAVRNKLGWTHQQWSAFKDKYGDALIMDAAPEFAVLATEETDDSANLGVSLRARGINPEEVEERIKVTWGALRADLRGIGLTTEEVNGAIAMQNFGEQRFANAMEMISAGVFGMSVKLQTRQKEIEQRLEQVREAISNFGTMTSEDRDTWVKEEDTLIKQYTSIGKLLSDIQRTWYEGSAQLALVRMRIRQESGNQKTVSGSSRNGKPGFTPRVMNPEAVEATEAAAEPPADPPTDLTPKWP